MTIQKTQKLDITYDHYKDSFQNTLLYLKQRERLFLALLVIIFVQFLEISVAQKSTEALNAFLENQLHYNFAFNEHFLNILVWFLLFAVSLKYFQSNILINKNYNYLHLLEDRLSKIAGEEDFIAKEGKHYNKSYRLFSEWTHIVYTWIFPLILIGVILIQIIKDFDCTTNGVLSGIFFVAIFVNTIFYLIALHQKNK